MKLTKEDFLNIEKIINKIISTSIDDRQSMHIDLSEVKLLTLFYHNQFVELPCKYNLIDLEGFSLKNNDFRGIDLRIFFLRGCNFSNCQFDKLSFGYLLSITREQELNLQYIDLIDEVIDRYQVDSSVFGDMKFDMPFDLSNLNMQYGNFSRTTFSGANLENTDLSYANLQDADLRGANMKCTNLSQADLSGALYTLEELSETIGIESAIFSDPEIHNKLENIQNNKEKADQNIINIILQELTDFLYIINHLVNLPAFIKKLANRLSKIYKKIAMHQHKIEQVKISTEQHTHKEIFIDHAKQMENIVSQNVIPTKIYKTSDNRENLKVTER